MGSGPALHAAFSSASFCSKPASGLPVRSLLTLPHRFLLSSPLNKREKEHGSKTCGERTSCICLAFAAASPPESQRRLVFGLVFVEWSRNVSRGRGLSRSGQLPLHAPQPRLDALALGPMHLRTRVCCRVECSRANLVGCRRLVLPESSMRLPSCETKWQQKADMQAV